VNLADLLQLTRPLIIPDLETTSSEVEVARIVQIGYRLHRPGVPAVGWHSLVDPLVEIPKESSEVHGITDEIIRDGCAKCRATIGQHPNGNCLEWKPIPTWKQIGPRIHQGFSGCDIAGYNVAFDINVMNQQLKRECDLELDMRGVRVIDAYRIWQVLEPRSLTDAVAYFGEEGDKLDGAHDAMNDVNGTERAFIGQLTRHRKSSDLPRTVEALSRYLNPDRIDWEGKFVFNKHGEVYFGFGKHKNQPVRLHMDYIKWMQRQGNWSSQVKEILDNILKGKFPERQS
jgi:DNA polymerase-3 subunit epsilon